MYRLQLRGKIWAFHAPRESRTVTEQQRFELMQHYMRHESVRIETVPHVPGDVRGKRTFDCYSIPRKRECPGAGSPRPCSRSVLRQSVVIDHRGGDGLPVRPQVVHDLLAHRLPSCDSAALVALACITNQACADHRISRDQEVWRKDLVDERLFGLSFDMHKQPYHLAESLMPSSRDGRPPISFFSHSCPRL